MSEITAIRLLDRILTQTDVQGTQAGITADAAGDAEHAIYWRGYQDAMNDIWMEIHNWIEEIE